MFFVTNYVICGIRKAVKLIEVKGSKQAISPAILCYQKKLQPLFAT